MTVREHIPLTTLTTFKVGGPARFVIECENEEDVRAGVKFAREQDVPYYVLGEGSNVLPQSDGFRGVLLLMKIAGVKREEHDTDTTMVAGAGVSWDALVREAAKWGLWGIENLAGIPGTVGAAPVQNIGAYGAELADTLLYVEAFDVRTSTVVTIPKDDCKLSYRDSRFKHEPNLIILRVAFSLQHRGTPRLDYADLQACVMRGDDLLSPRTIGEAVRIIRKDKFPDLAEFGTAGSFFKNPILTQDKYDALCAAYGQIPSYAHPNGVKIPLAFILDKVLHLRGYRRGHAWLFGRQPLVLVADLGAAAEEVEALAAFITERVRDVAGLSIEREVRTLNA
jgi:UDP-N-acetylmuramate dehydrogenase